MVAMKSVLKRQMKLHGRITLPGIPCLFPSNISKQPVLQVVCVFGGFWVTRCFPIAMAGALRVSILDEAGKGCHGPADSPRRVRAKAYRTLPELKYRGSYCLSSSSNADSFCRPPLFGGMHFL